MASGDECSKSDIKDLSVTKVLSVSPHLVISVCCGGDTLLAGSDQGVLLMWKDGINAEHTLLDLEIKDSINCICFVDKNQWLIGCGEKVIFISNISGQLVQNHTLSVSDEVNCIDVNEKVTYAAVADDSGLVSIVDLKTRKLHKKLLQHENICSSVKFRPKSPWSLVSAGLDCVLNLWNFKKGQVVGSVNTTEANSAPEDKDSYVVNPPLIHSLDITSDGLIAAAGLENGKIHLYTIGGKGFKFTSVVEAHHQGVSNVFITNEMMLISAGNDACVNIWNLSTARAPGKTLVWATLLYSVSHANKPSSIASIANKQLVVSDETERIAIYDYQIS